MRVVDVQTRERAYPVFIGPGARAQFPKLVHAAQGVMRVVFIADRHVADLHLERARGGLATSPAVLTFPPGEHSKSLEQLERLYAGLAETRATRRDLIVTLGGGVAGDLGGFAAATWMRGMRLVQMPTTLLAGIDASIGGKTAVNHPAGKNLIGAFYQPIAVIVDTDFLDTLPPREFVAGLAESVKHAVTRERGFFEWHERHIEEILARRPEPLEELIARNCEIKADVVARDEREEDLRMVLNHGHTIGHAIEHLLGYEMRHGECVAAGMIVENAVACARGILAADVAERIRSLLQRCGLSVRLPRRLPSEDVLAACMIDKKVRGGSVNFVLLTDLEKPVRLADVSAEEIAAALECVQPV